MNNNRVRYRDMNNIKVRLKIERILEWQIEMKRVID